MKETRIGSSHLIVTENDAEEKQLNEFLNPVPPEPTLPLEGRAVATFHSVGLYWTPPSAPAGNVVNVEYRKAGGSWRPGHPMWYDARNKEARGSVVYLDSDTQYEFRFSMPGGQPRAMTRARTWTEKPPVADVTEISGTLTKQYNISKGGSAQNGYHLYAPLAGASGALVDVNNSSPHCIFIDAPFVIVRGLTLKSAQSHAIKLGPNAKDVIIELNDISGWGRRDNTMSAKVGWDVGFHYEAGVQGDKEAERIVVQHCKIHDPRYGASPWDYGHPAGPNGIQFIESKGNHVLRWNSIYGSDDKHYFMDILGGENNFGENGYPGADSDIYGNYLSGSWDDAIEVEGGGRNVRVWGNYVDRFAVAMGSAVVHRGPCYIFRNVSNRNRFHRNKSADQDSRSTWGKMANVGTWGKGKRYVYHNTILQHPPEAGSTLPQGCGGGIGGLSNQPMTHTTSRNNIFHIWKDHWSSIKTDGGTEQNDFDYDLYNGTVPAGHEAHGIKGKPTYMAGHGPTALEKGRYQLSPGTPGSKAGQKIPNFSDGGNDIGAHEHGTPDLKFGHTGSGKGAGAV